MHLIFLVYIMNMYEIYCIDLYSIYMIYDIHIILHILNDHFLSNETCHSRVVLQASVRAPEVG